MKAEHKSQTDDLKPTIQLFQLQTQDFKPMASFCVDFGSARLAQLIKITWERDTIACLGEAGTTDALEAGHSISSSPLCLGLMEVPTGIPEDVVHIDLSFNSIRHLKAKDFQGARSLRTLNVSNNNMERMDTGMNRPLGNDSDMLILAPDANGGERGKNLFTHCRLFAIISGRCSSIFVDVCKLSFTIGCDSLQVCSYRAPHFRKQMDATLIPVSFYKAPCQGFCTSMSWICPTTLCTSSSTGFSKISTSFIL